MGNKEYKLDKIKISEQLADLMESISFTLIKTKKGRFIIWDDVNNKVYARNLHRPSEMIDVLSSYIHKSLYDDLSNELYRRGVVARMLYTSDEFIEFFSKNKDALKEFQSDAEQILLISNPDYIDKKCSLTEVCYHMKKVE